MTGLQTSRSWHLVTHWPKCETDALVGILPNRLADIEMQTIADTLAQVLVGLIAKTGGLLDTIS